MAQPPRRVARARGSRGRDGDALDARSVVLDVASRHTAFPGRFEKRRARQLTVAAAATCCDSAQLAGRDGDTLDSALALGSGAPHWARAALLLHFVTRIRARTKGAQPARGSAAQLGPSAARGIAVATRSTRCCSASCSFAGSGPAAISSQVVLRRRADRLGSTTPRCRGSPTLRDAETAPSISRRGCGVLASRRMSTSAGGTTTLSSRLMSQAGSRTKHASTR